MINIKTYLRQYKNDTAGIVWISFYVQRQKVNFSGQRKYPVHALKSSDVEC